MCSVCSVKATAREGGALTVGRKTQVPSKAQWDEEGGDHALWPQLSARPLLLLIHRTRVVTGSFRTF